jgi:hypothetical protein
LLGLASEQSENACIFFGIFIVYALAALAFHCIRNNPKSFLARHSTFCLLTIQFTLLLSGATLTPNSSGAALVWGFVAISAPLVWYFAYALNDAAAKNGDSITRQLGIIRPFWGGTNVPFPKGAANLRQIEAQDQQTACVLRLKAVKLLLWAFLLRVVRRGMELFLMGSSPEASTITWLDGLARFKLAIPTLNEAIHGGADPSLWLAWVIVLLNFTHLLIDMSIFGHVIIACCRASGFNALRNTYRPLESQTIAEFWNRFYYYFKELLVDFFFFPTFLRYFKKQRRLRLFLATFAAASFGNCLYHFARDYAVVASVGFRVALQGFIVYIFYSILLAAGIYFSQLRNQQRGSKSEVRPWWRRIISSLGVLLFFALIELFDARGGFHELLLRGKFLFGLFGIHV